MGGVNGTWLNEVRLRPEEPTPLSVGSFLRIGPYELILQGPELPPGAEEDDSKGEPISAPITPGLVGTGEREPAAAASVEAPPPVVSSTGVPVMEQPTQPPTAPDATLRRSCR